MTTPKRKKTRAKRDMRRANHDRVSAPSITTCSNCGDMMVPHRICPSCGHYKGREVVHVEVPGSDAGADHHSAA